MFPHIQKAPIKNIHHKKKPGAVASGFYVVNR